MYYRFHHNKINQISLVVSVCYSSLFFLCLHSVHVIKLTVVI